MKLITTIILSASLLATSVSAGGFNDVYVPTDRKATYEQQIIKDKWGVVSVKSHRVGPSGFSVSYIDFKCSSSKYRYINSDGSKDRWTKIHYRSIKYYQASKACNSTLRKAHKNG